MTVAWLAGGVATGGGHQSNGHVVANGPSKTYTGLALRPTHHRRSTDFLTAVSGDGPRVGRSPESGRGRR